MRGVISRNNVAVSVWVNEEVLFPQILQYGELLKNESASVSDLIAAIQSIDKRAISMYRTRFWSSNLGELRNSQLSMLQWKVQSLIYQKEWWVKDDSQLLITVLKKILEIVIEEVKSFLQSWDIHESGEDIALERINQNDEELAEIIESRINQWNFVPIPKDMDKDMYLERLSNELLKGNKWEIFKNLWTNSLQESIQVVTEKIIWSYRQFNGTYPNLSKISHWIGWLLLASMMYTTYHDYTDGHFSSIDNIASQHSSSHWEWEWEKMLQIIKEKVYPVLARGIHDLIQQWDEPHYNDPGNNLFYFSDDWISVDAPYWFNSWITIWDEYITYKKSVSDSGRISYYQVKGIKWDLWTGELLEMWLGDNIDFLMQVINHPDSIKEIRKLLNENTFPERKEPEDKFEKMLNQQLQNLKKNKKH